MRWIAHGIGGLLLVSIFLWLLYQNMVPSGTVTYVQDFVHRTPFVSDVWPPERIDPAIKTHEGAVRPIVEDPVSFFIHPPRVFQTSTIAITYKLKEPTVFDLAIVTGSGPDDIKIYPWESLESLGGDFWRGTITVPMTDWWRDEHGRYYAELLAQDLLAQKNELLVKEIRVTLTGRPHGFSEWREAFK